MLTARRAALWSLAAIGVMTASAADFAFTGLAARDLTPLAEGAVAMTDGAPLVLVRGGVCLLPVVHEDDACAAAAAGYLVDALEEMTGAEVTSYFLPAGVTNAISPCVYVPRPDAGDAFAVRVDADGISFSGRSDYAVYDFCERALGVRQYWDAVGGRSVLRGSEIAIPRLAYSDSPVFSFRRYSARDNPLWLRVAKSGGTFDRWTRCHTTDRGFCYGSPEGFAEYCRRIEREIAAGGENGRLVDYGRKTVSVSPWDVAYGCGCRWCRTLKSHLREPQGEATPIVWERFLPRLVDYLSVRHPDFRVSVLPYWNYVDAPKTPIAIGTNVQAEVCSMTGLAAFRRDAVREREEGIILDWERTTGRKVANWHYSCWPADYTPAPYVYGHTVADHYRRMRDHVVGSFICGGRNDFPRFSISLYVWMRCLWNPDVDVEAVYDEFCRRQFGRAAGLMREVIRIQEEDWRPETLMFPRESLLRLSELLVRSAELVRGTSAAQSFIYYVSGFSGVFDRQL